MRIPFWIKLALSMMLIMSITIAAGGYMGHQNFEKAFVEYLNDLQGERLEFLAEQLQTDYAKNENWDFIQVNDQTWQRYLRRNILPEASQEEESNTAKNGGRKARNDDRHISRAEHDDRLLARSLSLVDAQEQLIVGATVQNNSRSLLTPLHDSTRLIGYLKFQPFAELTESIDHTFAKQRKKSYLIIGILSLVFTTLASWGFSRLFHSTILKLTESAKIMAGGDYSQRIELNRNDEIGQLAQSFNVLSRSLEKNQQARQQWIADISHELRTPLAVLRGELEALEDGVRKLTPEAISSLTSEVNHLNKLVGDLYELSLSDLGALNYQMLDTQPSEVLTTTFNAFQGRFEKADLEYSMDIDDGAAKVLADESRLTQLFSNLFENSARYTDAGGKVKVSCSVNHKRWEMRLEDSSPAVEAEHIPHLFERFYRTDASRGRLTGGAGLGLAIASEIVEAHNGTITAHPSEFGGLLIVFQLPINYD